MNRVYSTRELAALCGVNESTIKRWADSGRLTCIKTPGGHRKFKMQDVLIFMEKHGFDASAVHPDGPEGAELPSDLDLAIRRKDHRSVAENYVRLSLSGGHHSVSAILMRLLSEGQSPIEVCDQIVAPALAIVGEHWANGTLSILEEHLISAATLEGLSLLAEKMPRAEPHHRRALCCPYEGDVHEIGVRMTALALESKGWTAATSVHSAPLEEVGRYVEQHKPDLLCLSIVYAPADHARRDAYEKLWEISRRCGTRVALGGRGAGDAAGLPCDFRGTSLAALLAWTRQVELDAPVVGSPRSEHARSN